jgi:hypothetical protein
MKKVLFLMMALMMCFAGSINAQIDSLVMTQDGYKPITLTIDSVNQKTLHDRFYNFCLDFWKNPDEVIKVNESDRIRVSGQIFTSYQTTLGITTGFPVYATVLCEFKDGKFRISFSNIYFGVKPSQYNGYATTQDFNPSGYFKKDGSPRTGEMYVKGRKDFDSNMQLFVKDIYQKLSTQTVTNSGW